MRALIKSGGIWTQNGSVCGGVCVQMRDSDCAGRRFTLEAHKIEHVFYAALIVSCGLNWPIFLFQNKRSERNE